MNNREYRQDPKPVEKFDANQAGPLDGVRVLDLSRLVAGNMLSLQLGDFGADVIKVEPFEGDPLRDWRELGASLHWKVYGRNKRSIAMNLRNPRAKEVLVRLAGQSDVFIENFRPGTLESMGLSPQLLQAENPDLVIVRISGFGQTGPYAALPGFGTLVEAMSGFAALAGFADREPLLPPLALADMIAGIYGAMATLVALRARDSGAARGQVIDLSLLESIFSILGPTAAVYRLTGKIKERAGSASNTTAPRNVYRCRDGKFVALSGSTQAMAKRIFEVIGAPGMIDDPRFHTNDARVRHRTMVDEAIGTWFATRAREDALAQMRAAQVTVGPVYDIDDIVANEHFRARPIVVDVEDDELGTLPMHNVVPRLSATPGLWRHQAPEIGEHTEQILRAAGYDDATIVRLREESAIR